ncbi:MAG: hypothetical protein U1F09_14635 [Steroidobacteraceae bacterium]
MRRTSFLACVAVAAALSYTGIASAGAVRDVYANGAYGLPWNADKGAIEARYPGGKWDQDDKGHPRYCVASHQTLLKLPAQFQSQQLCFLIGKDGTLASAAAVLQPSLQSLLAIVNRCRTTFGDFDSVVRDQQAIQSRSTAMLWTRESPYVVRVESQNDPNGSPLVVTYTVADEANLYTDGAAKVATSPANVGK